MAGLAELASKYLLQILSVVVVFALYFAWEHHVQTVQKEKDAAVVAKRDAKTAEDSAKLMAEEKAKVEQASKEQSERLQNAITIYATRTHNLSSDVDNLTNRLRNNSAKAGRCENTLPGNGDDNQERERRNNEADTDIARAAIRLANLCEKKVNELKVVN